MQTQSEGFTAPISHYFGGKKVRMEPILDKSGKTVTTKRSPTDPAPTGQFFSMRDPETGKQCVIHLERAQDPYPGYVTAPPNPDGGPRTRAWVQYMKPGGHMFGMPVDNPQSPDEQGSSVSREVKFGRTPKDLYESKPGFSLATPEDVVDVVERGIANAKAAAERKRAQNPMEVMKVQAELQAEMLKGALAGGYQAGLEKNRDAGKKEGKQ